MTTARRIFLAIGSAALLYWIIVSIQRKKDTKTELVTLSETIRRNEIRLRDYETAIEAKDKQIAQLYEIIKSDQEKFDVLVERIAAGDTSLAAVRRRLLLQIRRDIRNKRLDSAAGESGNKRTP